MTNLKDLIQGYYQSVGNEVRDATDIHQLDTMETNHLNRENFYRQQALEVKEKFQNINSGMFKDKLDEIERDLDRHMYATVLLFDNKRKHLLRKGLTPERMQEFHHYVADESNVGEQCTVCIQNVQVVRKMMRLDCKHEFCVECIEGWFAHHKTCPNCRQSF